MVLEIQKIWRQRLMDCSNDDLIKILREYPNWFMQDVDHHDAELYSELIVNWVLSNERTELVSYIIETTDPVLAEGGLIDFLSTELTHLAK